MYIQTEIVLISFLLYSAVSTANNYEGKQEIHLNLQNWLKNALHASTREKRSTDPYKTDYVDTSTKHNHNITDAWPLDMPPHIKEEMRAEVRRQTKQLKKKKVRKEDEVFVEKNEMKNKIQYAGFQGKRLKRSDAWPIDMPGSIKQKVAEQAKNKTKELKQKAKEAKTRVKTAANETVQSKIEEIKKRTKRQNPMSWPTTGSQMPAPPSWPPMQIPSAPASPSLPIPTGPAMPIATTLTPPTANVTNSFLSMLNISTLPPAQNSAPTTMTPIPTFGAMPPMQFPAMQQSSQQQSSSLATNPSQPPANNFNLPPTLPTNGMSQILTQQTTPTPPINNNWMSPSTTTLPTTTKSTPVGVSGGNWVPPNISPNGSPAGQQPQQVAPVAQVPAQWPAAIPNTTPLPVTSTNQSPSPGIAINTAGNVPQRNNMPDNGNTQNENGNQTNGQNGNNNPASPQNENSNGQNGVNSQRGSSVGSGQPETSKNEPDHRNNPYGNPANGSEIKNLEPTTESSGIIRKRKKGVTESANSTATSATPELCEETLPNGGNRTVVRRRVRKRVRKGRKGKVSKKSGAISNRKNTNSLVQPVPNGKPPCIKRADAIENTKVVNIQTKKGKNNRNKGVGRNVNNQKTGRNSKNKNTGTVANNDKNVR